MAKDTTETVVLKRWNTSLITLRHTLVCPGCGLKHNDTFFTTIGFLKAFFFGGKDYIYLRKFHKDYKKKTESEEHAKEPNFSCEAGETSEKERA